MSDKARDRTANPRRPVFSYCGVEHTLRSDCSILEKFRDKADRQWRYDIRRENYDICRHCDVFFVAIPSEMANLKNRKNARKRLLHKH